MAVGRAGLRRGSTNCTRRTAGPPRSDDRRPGTDLCSLPIGKPLERRDGPVGQHETSVFALADHLFDGGREKAAGERRVADLSGALQIIPGDLHGMFDEMGQVLAHAELRLAGALVPRWPVGRFFMADLETFNFRTFSTDEQMRNDKRAPTLGGKGEIAMADKTADNTGDNTQKDPKDWVSGDDR